MRRRRGQRTAAVSNRQRLVRVRAARLRAAALAAAEFARLPAGAISVAVVGDRKMRELNRRFSGSEETTDVLAFELATAAATDGVLGEVVVNAAVARAEAARRGWVAGRELLLYVVHGVLHLGGYRDKTPAQRKRMRRAEAAVMKRVTGDCAGFGEVC